MGRIPNLHELANYKVTDLYKMGEDTDSEMLSKNNVPPRFVFSIFQKAHLKRLCYLTSTWSDAGERAGDSQSRTRVPDSGCDWIMIWARPLKVGTLKV